MDAKYKLTESTIQIETGFAEEESYRVCRIQALKDFGDVKAGDIGGFIQSEDNLSQEGDCWVYDDSVVYGKAMVHGDAKVMNNSEVYNNAVVCGNSTIIKSRVYENAYIMDKASICNSSCYGHSYVIGNAIVTNSSINDVAYICGDAHVSNIWAGGNITISGDAYIESMSDFVHIYTESSFINTFYRNINNGISLSFGPRDSMTLEKFKEKVKRTMGDTVKGKKNNTLIEFVENMLDKYSNRGE